MVRISICYIVVSDIASAPLSPPARSLPTKFFVARKAFFVESIEQHILPRDCTYAHIWRNGWRLESCCRANRWRNFHRVTLFRQPNAMFETQATYRTMVSWQAGGSHDNPELSAGSRTRIQHKITEEARISTLVSMRGLWSLPLKLAPGNQRKPVVFHLRPCMSDSVAYESSLLLILCAAQLDAGSLPLCQGWHNKTLVWCPVRVLIESCVRWRH
jgi:hypothetical protein